MKKLDQKIENKISNDEKLKDTDTNLEKNT